MSATDVDVGCDVCIYSVGFSIAIRLCKAMREASVRRMVIDKAPRFRFNYSFFFANDGARRQ